MAGFGPIFNDNRRILLMEWLMEGLLLIFIGSLVVAVTRESDRTAVIVYQLCALVLLIMAGISLFTGARTAIVPMKLCPPIFNCNRVVYPSDRFVNLHNTFCG